jgi:hypothetical protein
VKLVVGELGKVCLKEHSKSLLYRPSLLLAFRGFKAPWVSGPGVQQGVHGVEQRQIAQLETIAKIALRKDIAAHHHGFRLTLGFSSQNLLGFLHRWLAIK